MSSITISLPQTLKDFVEHEVSTHGFGNVSEYFRSLLREAQARDAQRQLESRLVAGLGADSAPADSTFWSQLRAEAERLIAERPLPMTPWPATLLPHRAALAALCEAHAVRELALLGASMHAGPGPHSDELQFAVHLGEVAGEALATRYAQFSRALTLLLKRPIDLIEIGSMGPTRLRRLIEQTRRVLYAGPSGG
jgi:antitoxin ParD1/3/4